MRVHGITSNNEETFAEYKIKLSKMVNLLSLNVESGRLVSVQFG